MTGKHRNELVDAIQALANAVSFREQRGAELHVVGVLGLRDPESQDITFYIRVADPDRKLSGSGIEGMAQLGPGEFSFHKAEVAEHLSMLLADDYLNLAEELVREAIDAGKETP